MPSVIHSYRGDNRAPRLKLPKGERDILANAAGLCRAIQASIAGHLIEVSANVGKLASELERWAAIEELDLTKPF